jgi:hypothetical protein
MSICMAWLLNFGALAVFATVANLPGLAVMASVFALMPWILALLFARRWDNRP